MKKSDKVTFRHGIDFSQLQEDLVKAAQIAGAPYDREAFTPPLEAYRDYFSNSPLLFRTSTAPEGKRRLNVRFIELEEPIDPYPVAFANNYIAQEDHPIFELHDRVLERSPIAGYGVDIDVAQGLQKIWLFLMNMIPVTDVLDLPCFPESFRTYADYFARYNFNSFEVLAFDYSSKTTNLYFIPKDYAPLSPDKVAGIIGDLGLEVPSQEILGYCCRAISIYPTFSWDAPDIHRICFTVPAPQEGMLPTHLDPLLARFYAEAPMQSQHNQRIFMFSPTPSRDGMYIKIENDYTGTVLMMMRSSMEERP